MVDQRGGTIFVPDSHYFSVRDRISWDVSICFVPIDYVSWQDTSKGELHVKAWLEHETQGGYPSTPSAVWEFEVLWQHVLDSLQGDIWAQWEMLYHAFPNHIVGFIWRSVSMYYTNGAHMPLVLLP